MRHAKPFRTRRNKPTTPYRRSGRRGNGPSFGTTVALGTVLVFSAVYYWDQLPAAAQGLISASRNLGRDHAPPIGAYYPNCGAARAAGVAPIYAGEPGYRPEMDGDDDGVACEPYRGM